MKAIPDFLTPPECARWLKLSLKQLRTMTNAGTIPVVRLNGRVLRYHRETIVKTLA